MRIKEKVLIIDGKCDFDDAMTTAWRRVGWATCPAGARGLFSEGIRVCGCRCAGDGGVPADGF